MIHLNRAKTFDHSSDKTKVFQGVYNGLNFYSILK